MNRVFILGNLVRDPEARQVGENTCVTFTVASRREYRNKQTGQYDSDFLRCTAWGKTGEHVMKYAAKGTKILVEGTIQIRKYEKNGADVYVTDINASHVELMGPGKQAAAAADDVPDDMPAGFTETEDDHLPF